MRLNIVHKKNRDKKFKPYEDVDPSIFESGLIGHIEDVRIVTEADFVRCKDKRQLRKYFRRLGKWRQS